MLAAKETCFIFEDILNQQLGGVSMGAPLGSTLANVFLCHCERKWMHDCSNELKPQNYRRYVDETFVIFERRDQAERFLNYLDEKHVNINFTMKQETEISISFLDVNVKRLNTKMLTSV